MRASVDLVARGASLGAALAVVLGASACTFAHPAAWAPGSGTPEDDSGAPFTPNEPDAGVVDPQEDAAAPPGPDAPVTPGPEPVPDAARPDVQTNCGRAGQSCCGGTACNGSLGCLDWGGGTKVCGACGVRGARCCPGGACSQGACVTVLGSLGVCTDDAAPAERVGGSCMVPTRPCSSGIGTACVQASFQNFYCVACGSQGLPCCWGLDCPGGGTCGQTPSGFYVCR